jgi:guanyl-specific ribonuclease Sa
VFVSGPLPQWYPLRRSWLGVGIVAAALLSGPEIKDGATFGNRERRLPARSRGFYREYTVALPGARDRGAQRIVCGGPPRLPEACYYTADHYSTFRRITP